MATTKISLIAAQAACDAIVDRLDAAAGSPNQGRVEIRSGALPSNADDSPSGTILAILPLPNTAFGAAADVNPGARATANAIASTTGLAAGTAGHFLARDGAGVVVLAGDITATGGGGAMEINSTSIAIGATVQITAWTVTMPES